MTHSLDFRIAKTDDIFSLIKLHYLSKSKHHRDVLFSDFASLKATLENRDYFWIVGEDQANIVATASVRIDHEQGVARLFEIRVLSEDENRIMILQDSIRFLIERVLEKYPEIDIIYSTTRALTLKEQEATIDLGFKILGVFPSAMTLDPSRLNGLAIRFGKDVMEKKRFGGFSLHPGIARLFEIAREETGLRKLPYADLSLYPPLPDSPVPPLEFIEAPKFVAHQFQSLRERGFLSSNYYPFQEPNILVTDPAQSIGVFVEHFANDRFATINGEHMKAFVNPVDLYKTVGRMLYERNVAYIEVVCDAADVTGIDAILKAGYLPCAFFPALKRHGRSRRDYVVFARTYERVWEVQPDIHPRYLDYLKQYFKAEAERGMVLA